MNILPPLLSFGPPTLLIVGAFAFSLRVLQRYRHAGFLLLCISLGLLSLSECLHLPLAWVTVEESPSFLLWSCNVLRLLALLLMLAGWILLSSRKHPILARVDTHAAGPLVGSEGLWKWGSAALLIISLLALVWAFLIVFAAGMKTVPQMTTEELWQGVLPSLVLFPISLAVTILGIRWAEQKLPTVLAVASLITNILSAAIVLASR